MANVSLGGVHAPTIQLFVYICMYVCILSIYLYVCMYTHKLMRQRPASTSWLCRFAVPLNVLFFPLKPVTKAQREDLRPCRSCHRKRFSDEHAHPRHLPPFFVLFLLSSSKLACPPAPMPSIMIVITLPRPLKPEYRLTRIPNLTKPRGWRLRAVTRAGRWMRPAAVPARCCRRLSLQAILA